MKRRKIDEESGDSTQEALDMIDEGMWRALNDSCLNLGAIGPAGIPKLAFRGCAKGMFPERNGHNTFYYRFAGLVEPHIVQWIDDLVKKLIDKNLLSNIYDVEMPKTNKCGKCNCKFSRKNGVILRHPVVLQCGCHDWRLVTSCLRCRLVQWLLEGSFQTKLYGLDTLALPTHPHPGYSTCSACHKPWSIRNIRIARHEPRTPHGGVEARIF